MAALSPYGYSIEYESADIRIRSSETAPPEGYYLGHVHQSHFDSVCLRYLYVARANVFSGKPDSIRR